MGSFHFGSAGGLIIAFVLAIIALSTPGWIYVSIQWAVGKVHFNRSIAIGLFYSEPNISVFLEYPTDEPQTGLYPGGTAVSVCVCFLCIGLSYLSFGIMTNLYSGNYREEKKLAKIGGIMGLAASIFVMIGMASFTGLALNSPVYLDMVDRTALESHGYTVDCTWGYSFAFGWTVFAVSLIAGAVGLLGRNESDA